MSNNQKRISLIILMGIFVGHCSAVKADGTSRIWVDNSGNHSIEASFSEVRDGRVYLINSSGKKISIDLSQLSEDDLKYVEKARALAANRLRLQPPMVKQTKPLPPLDLPPATIQLDENATLSLGPATIELKGESLPFSVHADPAPAHNLNIPAQLFKTGKIHNYHVCSAPLLVGNKDNPAIGVSVSDGFSSPEKVGVNRLVRFDAITNKSKTVFKGDERIDLLDHHLESGRSLFLVGHNALGNGGYFAMGTGWESSEITLKNKRLLPTDERLGHSVGVRWARLLDDETVIALIDQTLFCINLVSGEELYAIKGVSSKSTPDISGGRRHIAIPFFGGVDLIQSIDGQKLGRIRTDPGMMPTVKFSPSGHAIAIFNSRRLRVWGLREAALLADVESRRSFGSNQPIWIDSDLLLSSSGTLVSLFRSVPVWHYDVAGCEMARVCEQIVILRKHPNSGLSVQDLPHAAAQRAMKWIDSVQITTSPKTWKIPGHSNWVDEQWSDSEVRIGKANGQELRQE